MNSINIARTIAAARKQKGITQDELATFIGVSKASVSKWETGQSYPDITHLPRLAAYFNISLDELMSYEPQMTDDEIRKLYEQISEEFATKPFDEVRERVQKIVKQHYSCFPLIFQMGLLSLNHATAAKDGATRLATIEEAKELFIRVKTLCSDVELKNLALHLESVCEMMLGNACAVIALHANERRHALNPSVEVMLAQSYILSEEPEEAKIVLQRGLLYSIAGFFEKMPSYLNLCLDDKDRFEEACKRTFAMIDTFNVDKVSPAEVLPIYLAAAYGYLTFGDTDKALTVLETYTEIVSSDAFSLMPKSDNFFTLLDKLSEENKITSAPKLPRDEQSIKRDIVDHVVNNPRFSCLSHNQRFQNLAKRLKGILEDAP